MTIWPKLSLIYTTVTWGGSLSYALSNISPALLIHMRVQTSVHVLERVGMRNGHEQVHDVRPVVVINILV